MDTFDLKSNSLPVRVLIIEDEQPAARRLHNLLRENDPAIELAGTVDSVKGSVQWLKDHPTPDLIFLDIQLADGLSFDIFNQVKVQSPIIFTTAFDQYTLQAFKLHSVDYLLKPIDPEELQQALEKFRRYFGKNGQEPDLRAIQKMVQAMQQPSYKERFIVKAGQQLTYVTVSEVLYLYADDGLVYLKASNGKRHLLDYTLEQLEELLDPKLFFRLNRKIITHIQAVRKVSPYFNSRLAVELHPKPEFQVVVSRDRVSDFKAWMDQ